MLILNHFTVAVAPEGNDVGGGDVSDKTNLPEIPPLTAGLQGERAFSDAGCY